MNQRTKAFVCLIHGTFILTSGHRASDDFSDDMEIAVTHGAHEILLNAENASRAEGKPWTKRCCCKVGACKESRRSKGTTITDFWEWDWCCKPRRLWKRKTTLPMVSCSRDSEYTNPVDNVDYQTGYTYDHKTCAALGAPNRLSPLWKKLKDAFTCPHDFVCPTGETDEDLPAEWKAKPLICRTNHKALLKLQPKATKWFDSTQGTGTANSLAVSGVDVVATQAELLSVGLAGTLSSTAAGIGAASQITGAAFNLMKLIDGVCAEGTGFLGTCPAKVSMTAVTVASTALALTFTGVGVPVSALLLGITSICVRRIGPMMCELGVKKTVKKLGEITYEALREISNKVVTLRVRDLPSLAKRAAKGFFSIFWNILKSFGLFVKKGFKKIFRDTNKHDIKQSTWACCQMQNARSDFVDMKDVEDEVQAELMEEDDPSLVPNSGTLEEMQSRPVGSGPDGAGR